MFIFLESWRSPSLLLLLLALREIPSSSSSSWLLKVSLMTSTVYRMNLWRSEVWFFFIVMGMISFSFSRLLDPLFFLKFYWNRLMSESAKFLTRALMISSRNYSHRVITLRMASRPNLGLSAGSRLGVWITNSSSVLMIGSSSESYSYIPPNLSLIT